MRSSSLAVLGTARDGPVMAAVGGLLAGGHEVSLVVAEGRAAAFADAGCPVRTFAGRITPRSLGLLRTLRDLRADGIVVVVGDQFAHANVITALNWWRTVGLLQCADVFVSESTQPAVIECYNSSDPLGCLLAAAGGVILVAAAMRRPRATTAIASFVLGAEWWARTQGRRREPRCSPWVPRVSGAGLGEALRPVSVTRWETTPTGDRRVTRTTVDARLGRLTSPAQGSPGSRPVVTLYGGTWTFGLDCSDEATFGWQLARRLPGYEVRCQAVPGEDFATSTRRLQDDADRDPALSFAVVVDEPVTQGSGLPFRHTHVRAQLMERSVLLRLLWDACAGPRHPTERAAERARLAATARSGRRTLLVVALGNTEARDWDTTVPGVVRCVLPQTTSRETAAEEVARSILRACQ